MSQASHSAAVNTNGLVFGWGNNEVGQVGTAPRKPAPVSPNLGPLSSFSAEVIIPWR